MQNKSQNLYILIIILGFILRLSFLNHMEWKYDQAWMFYSSLENANSFTFPWIGMKSGGGISNPGVSVWVFTLLGFIFKTPIKMALGVAFLNIFAILGFLFFGLKRDSHLEKNLILKTSALWSVAPLAFVFSRSIWAQDILAPFVIIFILSAYYRKKTYAASLWGFFGALLGQIHMPGFFYAFGFFIFLFFKDFKRGEIKHYGPWLLGSFLGALLLLPWLNYLLEMPKIVKSADPNNSGVIEFKHIFKFRFYTYSILDAFGIHLKYSIGKAFKDFLKFPSGLYLSGFLHVFLSLTGVMGLVFFIKKRREIKWTPFDEIWGASLIGGGLVLTLIGLKMHPHYIICALPFSYYLAIRLLETLKPWVTPTFIVAQLFVTTLFLTYVVINDGVPEQEYGKSYQSQLNDGSFDVERDKSQFHLKMKH